MNTKLVKGLLIFITLIIVLVIADYFAFLGSKTKKILSFSEIRFKTVDEQSGAPIVSTKAVCYRHGNHGACSIRDSGKLDIVSVQFPVHKIQENSWLFTQSEEFIMPADPDINIMLIHNDYHSVKNNFDMRDIHLNSGQLFTVKMQPKQLENQEQNSDE